MKVRADRTYQAIFEEYEQSQTRLLGARHRLAYLSMLYPNQFNFPALAAVRNNKKTRRPDPELIGKAYWDLSQKKSRSAERQRTHAEIEFMKRLVLQTKKHTHSSVWIGAHCVDLFVPNVRSNDHGKHVMRGLAIEIDGRAHDHESKMRKDELKTASLSILGIGEASIRNSDFNEPTVRILRDGIRNLRPLDSRDRRRLWCRIHALTLAIHLSDSEFFVLFGGPQ